MAQLVAVTVRTVTMEEAGGGPVTVPKAGVKIYANLSGPTWEDGEVIIPTQVKGLTDINGECVLMLYANESGGNPTNWLLSMYRPKVHKQVVEVTALIPAGVAAIDLADCLVATGTTAGGGANGGGSSRAVWGQIIPESGGSIDDQLDLKERLDTLAASIANLPNGNSFRFHG